MIRQAISCDVCGAEKRQTNHWFVAYTQGGELRVMGWSANRRLRAGSKHLCGQTCLHKLVDEFIAGTMASRTQGACDPVETGQSVAGTDASLTSKAAYPESAEPNGSGRALQVVPPAVIAIASATRSVDPAPGAPLDEAPRYGSRRWRAEAWERERERERRAVVNTHRKTL